VFYQDFREIIKEIESDMDKGDELIINMASGTPAMKSAILVMATLAEYRFKPIQVSTPQKSMNSELEDRTDYDVDANWELNSDNTDDFVNRCEEIQCLNLIKLLKLDIIKKHLNAYDYTAALSVAEEIKQDISEDVYTLLKVAVERVKLNINEINRLTKGLSYPIFPIKDGDKQKIFEYALVLQMKLQKEEYADFTRGITPIVVDLLEMILNKQYHIKVADYCYQKEGLRWDKKKLEDGGLLEIFNEAYKDGFKAGQPVYSHNLAVLIHKKSNDVELNEKVTEISEAERNVRNMAAHEIVSVTKEWFEAKAKVSADTIFADIKDLMVKAGINAKKEDWNSYDEMNNLIISLIDQS
jgi:CRISPR type III-A/MTUBE-associated protein Csm6